MACLMDGPAMHGVCNVQVKWPKLGPSKIVKNFRIEKASDFWNRYEQDIQLAKDLGATQMAAQRPLLWAALYEGRAMALRDCLYKLFSWPSFIVTASDSQGWLQYTICC